MESFPPLTLPMTLRPRFGPMLRGTLVMLLVGAGCWWAGGQSSGLTTGLLYACAVVSLLLTVFLLWALLTGRAGLELTTTGFKVIGPFSSLAVPWTDVSEFGLDDVGTKTLLLWRYRPNRVTAYRGGTLTRLSQALVPGWDASTHISAFTADPAALAAFMQNLADQHSGKGVGIREPQ